MRFVSGVIGGAISSTDLFVSEWMWGRRGRVLVSGRRGSRRGHTKRPPPVSVLHNHEGWRETVSAGVGQFGVADCLAVFESKLSGGGEKSSIGGGALYDRLCRSAVKENGHVKATAVA